MGSMTILDNRPHRFTFLIILQFIVGFLWLIGIIAAALFAFPFSPVYEGNSLEIGIFYIEKVLKNPDRRKLILDHLINQHILDNGYAGGEEILRAGELRYSTELLALTREVISCCLQAKYALAQMTRSGNFDSMDEYKQKIYKASLKLANWLSKHPMDEEQERQFGDWCE